MLISRTLKKPPAQVLSAGTLRLSDTSQVMEIHPQGLLLSNEDNYLLSVWPVRSQSLLVTGAVTVTVMQMIIRTINIAAVDLSGKIMLPWCQLTILASWPTGIEKHVGQTRRPLNHATTSYCHLMKKAVHNRIRTDWYQGHVLQQQIHKMKQDIKNEGKIEYKNVQNCLK